MAEGKLLKPVRCESIKYLQISEISKNLLISINKYALTMFQWAINEYFNIILRRIPASYNSVCVV